VIYYGGPAMTQGAAKAEAAKLINQGQQLMGAADLYKSDTGSWPADIPILLTSKHLKSEPVGTGDQKWVMPREGVPTFVLSGVSKESCQNVNLYSLKSDGVLARLTTSYATQCYS